MVDSCRRNEPVCTYVWRDYTDDGFYTGAWSDIEQTYGGRSGIDWQDKIFGGSALTQSHNLSLSTGTEKNSSIGKLQ